MSLRNLFGTIKDDAVDAAGYAAQAQAQLQPGRITQYPSQTGMEMAMRQQQAMMNSAVVESEMRMAKSKITHIEIEEASNGLIVRMGSDTRICTDSASLAEAVATLYAMKELRS